MPTRRSVSTTTSATTASPRACCRCSTARRVVLLTNNPAKLDGLAKAGIEIAGRMPLEAPINSDNRRYLTAKAARAGHQLDHVLASLAEPSAVTHDVAPLAP